jgi:hypothetical protein
MKTPERFATALAAVAVLASGCASDEMLDPEAGEEITEPAGEPPAQPPAADVELMIQRDLIDETFEGDGGNLEAEAYTVAQLEGENMADRRGWSGVYWSPYAIWGNGYVRTMFANGEIGNWVWVPTTGQHQISIGAQGSWCTHGWPVMTTYAYDQSRGWYYGTGSYGINSNLTYDPNARYFPYYVGSTWMNAGWNWVSVVMSNDSYVANYCDANLVVDYVNIWHY